MIDPATGWVEIREIPTKRADVVANIVDAAWFTRYPLPKAITCDNGKEFMAEFSKMVKYDYGIEIQNTTVRNPQGNSMVERMHQTLGNIVRTFPLTSLDPDDPWTGILSAAMFAIRATFHTTLKATPAQLVFGRDSIVNTKFTPDWNAIKQQKQERILENNRRENAKRKAHEYKVGDLVLYKDAQTHKYGRDAYNGPFDVIKVNKNGTIRIKMDTVSDVVNIRHIKPYII
jgi:transposase InsO family protein